jgi:hypothetical protein
MGAFFRDWRIDGQGLSGSGEIGSHDRSPNRTDNM